ncbi:MAG TPA: hypothetical protein VN931_09000 [Fibrobacteria bacterium]|nr:hypothetical protein [Fibrobacteria bacterium]
MEAAILELQERIDRLDRLIRERDDGIRGLGIRLALGLALEIRKGVVPGSETGAIVSGWAERFGPAAVDEAVVQARVLLADPARMATEFQRRMDERSPEPPDA